MKNKESEEELPKVTNLPTYILKKILRPKCTVIHPDGSFSISLINAIAPIKIVKHNNKQYKSDVRIQIDDTILDIDDFWIIYQGIETAYSHLDPLNGYIINLGDEVIMHYRGPHKLTPGKHFIDIEIKMEKPIRIKFSANFIEGIL